MSGSRRCPEIQVMRYYALEGESRREPERAPEGGAREGKGKIIHIIIYPQFIIT